MEPAAVNTRPRACEEATEITGSLGLPDVRASGALQWVTGMLIALISLFELIVD